MARGKYVLLSDKMTTKERIQLFTGEVFGTLVLVFLGCSGCVADIYRIGFALPHEQVCLTFGLAVMIAVQVFGHISGSHINPIVTVTALTMGYISLLSVPVYFLGQFTGAIAGYGLLMAVTPGEFLNKYTLLENGTKIKNIGACSPAINSSITPLQGLLVEFTITLFLAWVCCAVWDPRNNTKHDSVPIRFGLTIAGLALAGGPYTGANMNPARSFAPALFNGDWEHHWLYWVGPLSAGFLGALSYRLLWQPRPQDDVDLPEATPLNERKA